MIYLNKLKNLRIYRNKQILLDPIEKNKRQGNIIFLAGQTQEENINLINSSLINNKYFKNYFVPMKNEYFLGTAKKYKKIQRKDIYQLIKERTLINRTVTTITSNKDYNLFFDLSFFQNIFFSNNLSYKKKLDSFYNGLKNIIKNNNLNNFKRKFIVIPYNLNSSNLKKELMQMKFNSILEFIFQIGYRNPELLDDFKDITFIILDENTKRIFKFTGNDLSERKNLNKYAMDLQIINKIKRKEPLSQEEQELDNDNDISSNDNLKVDEEEPIAKKFITDIKETFSNKQTKYNSFTGESGKIEDKIEAKIETITNTEENKNKSENDIKELIEQDEDLKQYAKELKENEIITAKNSRNNKRNLLLKEEQKNIKINNDGKTLSEILSEVKEKKIENKKMKTEILNEELNISNLKDFAINYKEKVYQKDLISTFSCFSDSDKPIKMFIKKVEKHDSSNEFTKKETLTIDFEDERRKRHKINIDIPKIIDNYYLYINGNKKNVMSQFCPLPVIKTGPATVQVVSNYNKIFLERFGNKLTPKLERFKKFISKINNKSIDVVGGNNSKANEEYLTTIQYDELGKSIFSITINDTTFHFNQEHIREILLDNDIDISNQPEYYLPIAYDGKKVTFLNVKTEKIEGTDKDFLDFLTDKIIETDTKLEHELEQTKVGKSFVFTRATVVNRNIPLVILLAYKDGLSTVLRKSKIKYYLSEKRHNLSAEEKMTTGLVQFSNCFLYYEKEPIANSLLLNAFGKFPTREYTIEQFDEKEIYLEFFYNMYGTRAIGKAFDNVCYLFLDPITKEILKDLDLPTDFTELFLYANSLLSDSQLTPENNMSNYRFRDLEQLPSNVYKVLADAYANYVNSVSNGANTSFSVPKDAVMKEIITSQNVEDYSTLNPILEVEKLNNITYKGERAGLNLDEAFTINKRSYDPSMLGLLGISTPNNNKVGVTRFLSYNPRITSVRGYVKPGKTENLNEMDGSNLLTTSELVTCFASWHDDPPRTAMTTVQSKHSTPVKHSDSLLIGTGADKTLAQMISDDFAFKAKKDGIVEKIDEATNIIVLKYKDGTYDAVDCSDQLAKNGNGGFFINNTKEFKLKQGQRFKEGDVLAYNENFFKENDFDNNTNFLPGTLAKVAIYSGYYTFEDSCITSEHLCDKMISKIVMEKELVLGPNSNIDNVVKKGQQIKSGDPLIVFEESYREKEANILLAKIGDEVQEEIKNLGKNTIKSKYTGVIKDIKIYYTTPIEEFSPSVQKFIKEVNKTTIDKKKLLKTYFEDNDHNIILEPTEQIQTDNGKVKGRDLPEGLMIRFYIEYEDRMGVGDKLTFYTAVKSVIQQTVPEEISAYSEYRPEEVIDAVHPTISYFARMTSSITLNLYGNKVLVELKRKINDIYNA